MGKIAFVFSGQGAQYPGMGKELYETSAFAKAVFDEAEQLRPGTIAQCFFGTKDELATTINTQPCLFTMDLACARALEEAKVYADCAAGFSLGELAAVAFCGMLSFADAFMLVCERARLMQSCADKTSGAMAAILQLEAQTVEELCKEFVGVYPVNYNCPKQTVVSGSEQQLEKLMERVKELKGRAIKLAVKGSFHTPFMDDAAQGLSDYMQRLTFKKPSITLYANVTAHPYTDAALLLSQQVKSPVLWQKTIENMQSDGCDTFIEVGAGKTLCGLMKKIGEASVYNVEDPKSLLHTLEEIRKEKLC